MRRFFIRNTYCLFLSMLCKLLMILAQPLHLPHQHCLPWPSRIFGPLQLTWLLPIVDLDDIHDDAVDDDDDNDDDDDDDDDDNKEDDDDDDDGMQSILRAPEW